MELEFEYRIENNTVTIVKYIGHGRKIVIPETIDGRYVSKIEDYAFVNQRNIREIEFPRTMQRIGGHSFYDCRSLECVIFSDSITEVSDGAFKNCDSLHCVELFVYEGSLLCIKSLLQELRQEIKLWLNYDNGGCFKRACLIFPRYLHHYVEFTQARIINQETHGFGVHYRELVMDKMIDYKGYDELFLLVSKVEEATLCCKIAMARVIYPYQVSSAISLDYVQYLKDHIESWLLCLLEKEDMEQLQHLEAVQFFTPELMEEAILLAHEMGKLEFVSYFMTIKQRKFARVQKKFEF